jgi:hypothetical protein
MCIKEGLKMNFMQHRMLKQAGNLYNESNIVLYRLRILNFHLFIDQIIEKYH